MFLLLESECSIDYCYVASEIRESEFNLHEKTTGRLMQKCHFPPQSSSSQTTSPNPHSYRKQGVDVFLVNVTLEP